MKSTISFPPQDFVLTKIITMAIKTRPKATVISISIDKMAGVETDVLIELEGVDVVVIEVVEIVDVKN